MASKSENAEIAVLQDQMSRANQDITEIKGDVKTILQKFESFTGLQNEIDGLKAEITELKRAKFRNGVIYPSISAIAGAVIAALVVLTITRK